MNNSRSQEETKNSAYDLAEVVEVYLKKKIYARVKIMSGIWKDSFDA